MNVGSTQAVQDAAYAANNIVAVGTSGMILSSSGAQPVRPTLNFSAPTLAVGESAGTATLTINVAPPSPQPVTVLFTLSGSAVSPADFTVPSTVVSIPANGASQTITVTIKQDVLDEVNEAAVFSLGAPTGDAVLGPTSVHTLTINDDDQIPTFTAQPANTLAKVGSSVQLSATVAASGTLTPLPATLSASWKKNNAAVALVTSSQVVAMPAGATFKGDIAAAKLTDAGAYVVTVKNATASVPSRWPSWAWWMTHRSSSPSPQTPLPPHCQVFR